MSILSNVLGGLGKGVSSTGNDSNGYEEKPQQNTLDYKGPLKANKVVLDEQFEYDGVDCYCTKNNINLAPLYEWCPYVKQSIFKR